MSASSNLIQTVLFDLDGTLLDNDMDVFLPRYLETLSARVKTIMSPEEFLISLLRATEAMIANDGQKTNEQVFAEVFYPLVSAPRETLEGVFLEFYKNDFPLLERYTKCKPEARKVVQTAFDSGYDVVIATNPLFPATATQQRLEWAGLADFPYSLVTTYENSRAAKPNPLYFKQILEAVGHLAEAALVVGDEHVDMVAGHLGCLTFLVPSPRTNLAPTTPPPAYRGTLREVRILLESWR